MDLQNNMKELDTGYKIKLHEVGSRVEELTSMVKENKTSNPKTSHKESTGTSSSVSLSEDIDKQVNELEERITYVHHILKTRDVAGASAVDEEEDDSGEEDEDESDFLTSEEEESDEEDSHLVNKLHEMKKYLDTTNNKIRDITVDISLLEGYGGAKSPGSSQDEGWKNTLKKCGDKIDVLTKKLNEKVKAAKLGGAAVEGSSSENTLAFHHFVKQMRWKLVELNSHVAEHETLDAKSLNVVHGKVMNLLEYLNSLQRFKHKDYELLGKLSRHQISAQAILNERESRVKRSRLHFEEKIHMYADRLSVEAIILGQMAYLVQRYQMGDLYRDVLVCTIQDANNVIVDLEKKIDESTKTFNNQEDGVDLISSYTSILAEKIVLEGQFNFVINNYILILPGI